ncbi:MAG TPA: S8/S53 family peptidase [Actinomycetes bacterium]|nr:S8/S53 family peptidase [Actinomycetes bacterium]
MDTTMPHGEPLHRWIRDSTNNSAMRKHYHYKPNELVVGEDDRPRVTQALERRGMGVEVAAPLDGLGVCVLRLLRLEKSGATVPSIVRELREAWRPSVPKVGPNHVFRLLTHTMLTVFPPHPPSGNPDFSIPPAAKGAPPVVVGLLDSGFDPDNARLAASCRGDQERAPRDGRLPLGAGHGTFIAGKLLQEAPDVTIEVRDVIEATGHVDDGKLADTIKKLADLEHAGVLMISVGSPTEDDAGALAVQDALNYVRFNHPEIVVVAPAGNDASDRPIFPAAYKGVIGVGAVENVKGEWQPACFTSRGWWVDACAPGVDVLGPFFHYEGTLATPNKLPKHIVQKCGRSIGGVDLTAAGRQVEDFDGVAQWSGTSVAAPLVAGRIAAERQAGYGADEAVSRVLGKSGKSIPGLGMLVT